MRELLVDAFGAGHLVSPQSLACHLRLQMAVQTSDHEEHLRNRLRAPPWRPRESQSPAEALLENNRTNPKVTASISM